MQSEHGERGWEIQGNEQKKIGNDGRLMAKKNEFVLHHP